MLNTFWTFKTYPTHIYVFFETDWKQDTTHFGRNQLNPFDTETSLKLLNNFWKLKLFKSFKGNNHSLFAEKVKDSVP